MAKRSIGKNTPRKPRREPSFDYEDEDFLERVGALAYEGWYDAEIADELNVSRFEFSRAKSRSEKLSQTLSEARMRAKEDGAEIPSPPKFAKLWMESGYKRSTLIKNLGIRYTTLRAWERQDPRLTDVMAMTDLEFLEQIDTAGRILALGGVKGKDKFNGWNRYPSEYMIRFYLNTTGRRYGYGEAPVAEAEDEDIPTNVESGIDIESWIAKEMSAKKENKEDSTE